MTNSDAPSGRIGIDERLSDAWNATVSDGPRARPEHMWEICRQWQAAGLVVPNCEDVALLPIGPFHVAVPSSEAAFSDFIGFVLPFLIEVYGGNDLNRALLSLLPQSARIVARLIEQSCLIKDTLAWSVLIEATRQTADTGTAATVSDIVRSVVASLAAAGVVAAPDDVCRTIKELEHVTSLGGTPVALLNVHDDGSVVCRV